MKKIAFALILSIWAIAAYTQKPDDAFEALLQRAKSIASEKPDSAGILFEEVYKQAMAKRADDYAFKALRNKGLVFEEINRLNEAKDAYQRAKSLAESSLPKHAQLEIYTDWAILHKKLGEFSVAKEYHQRTIDEGILASDWEMVENGYHGLGTLFSMLSDFDQSLNAYLQSIEAARKWNNQKGELLTQQNIANIYMKARNYPMAVKNIQIAEQLAERQRDTFRIGTVSKIYGNIYLNQNILDSALQKLQLAQAIFSKLDKKAHQSEVWLSILQVFLKKGELSTADSALAQCNALKAFFSPYTSAALPNYEGKLRIAQGDTQAAHAAFMQSLGKTVQFGFKEIERENYLDLANIANQIGDLHNAVIYMQKAQKLSETIFDEERQRRMTEAKFKFDDAQKDFQISLQKEKLSNAQNWKWALVSGLGLLSVLLGFTFQQKKLKQKALFQTEVLLKELHHRTKNNLQTIISLMRIHAREVKDPVAQEVLNESRTRLEAMSLLHQRLYLGEHDVRLVNLKQCASDLIEKLKFSYGLADQVEANIEVIPEMVDVDIALPIALIINELITNSIKYAISEEQEPSTPLIIRIYMDKTRFFYSDNGIGYTESPDQPEKSGFGIKLIHSLGKKMCKNLRFYSNKGACFEMEF